MELKRRGCCGCYETPRLTQPRGPPKSRQPEPDQTLATRYPFGMPQDSRYARRRVLSIFRCAKKVSTAKPAKSSKNELGSGVCTAVTSTSCWSYVISQR